MARAAVTLIASLLVSSSKSLSCLSTFLFFQHRLTPDLRHRQVKSSRLSFPASSCPIFPITFSHVLRKESKHEESENGEGERTWGDDAKHSLADVARAVCVTHKSLNHKKHTIAAKPCLKSISQSILLVWFSSINSDLQSCSKKHTKKILFQTLVTILTIAFTHLFWWRFLSSAIRSPSQENERKMRIKTKKWKAEKVNFCHEHFDLEEHVKRRNQKKTGKEQKGQRKALKEKRWEMKRGEKKIEMVWRNECPGAEINDKWVHIELIRSTMSRHAAMVKRAFNCARDSQRELILK